MSIAARLQELRAAARYHRERLQLYRAKVQGPRPTSPGRLQELERESERADERLRQAERESRRPEGS